MSQSEFYESRQFQNQFHWLESVAAARDPGPGRRHGGRGGGHDCPITGSRRMHLQVTTPIETSAHTRTTAVGRRGTTGGLRHFAIYFLQLEEPT